MVCSRYTQTRGCSPSMPGSAASTSSACLVSMRSASIGCALDQSSFALDQSYAATPYLSARREPRQHRVRQRVGEGYRIASETL